MRDALSARKLLYALIAGDPVKFCHPLFVYQPLVRLAVYYATGSVLDTTWKVSRDKVTKRQPLRW